MLRAAYPVVYGLVSLGALGSCHPTREPSAASTPCATGATAAQGQTDTASASSLREARALAHHSSGAARDGAWLLTDNGYVGTYLRVERAGDVRISVRASGHPDSGTAPRMTISVGADQQSFEVAEMPADYPLALELPQGTHFVRVGYVNDAPDTSRELLIHSLRVEGAELDTNNSDENALAAADTSIEHYRRGNARLKLHGASPGTKLRLTLQRHAFNFGTNIPYSENRLIPVEVTAGTDAERFQKMVLGRFNTVVLSNGGKWLYQESARDRVDLGYVDRFLDFVEQHGLRARMHTMLWDTEQQPAWVGAQAPARPGLLTRALSGDERARRELSEEIDERIRDYVRQRAQRYQELDVLNESLHRPRYWQIYGTTGIAEIFNKTAKAVEQAGASTRLYLNEYNLMQWSEHPQTGGSDAYANWYRWHAEQLTSAGATLHGLGIQYYPDGRGAQEIGSSAHSAARIMQVLQNLAGTGLRLSLTEFAVNRHASPERAADILEQTLRLVFGTPQADSFLIWAIWESAAVPPPPSILFDKDARRTSVGERYDALMQRWHTDLELSLGPDGTLEFTGFYGDYRVSSDGKAGAFTLERGQAEYSIALQSE